MVRTAPGRDVWAIVRSQTGEIVDGGGIKAEGLTRAQATSLISRLLMAP